MRVESTRALALLLLPLCYAPCAERGGILHVVQRAEPKTWNPAIAADAPSRDILRRLHADLITIHRQSQTTHPNLAQSHKLSKDGRTYLLTLRRGLRFSDGAPFTADDVVFSFAVYLDEKVRSPQRDLLLIEDKPIEVTKVDSHTVSFRLPQPYAAAERLFDSVAMLPKHRLESAWRAGKLRDSWTLATAPSEIAGLGPFRLKEYRPGEAVILERNPYYWKNAEDGKPLPNLDGIEFRFLAGEEAQLARFASGDVDILNRFSPKAIAFLQANGARITDLGPGLDYNFLCFNLSPASPKRKWFADRQFRQALSLAVDRDAMVRIVYQGRASAIWGHVSPGNKLWHSSRLPHPSQSIPEARALLTKAGFRWDSKGALLDAAGTPVDFSILVSASSQERIQMATLLQADFRHLGIVLRISTMEFRAMTDRVLNTRQFDTCLMGLGGGDADPNPEMNVWLSSGGLHMWNPNQTAPSTPWESEIDSLMKRQMVTLNAAERKRLYDRVQQIVATEQPMIFLVSPNVVVAQRPRVGNFRPAILDHQTLWNAEELFLSKGAAAR